ncbi:hypothetical protein [Brassicibacter mesophilus]|uniref:hypothetical protein n=1 Tax=Brassicibacter mesophilus TaxID=745119 RepID=UPI003D1C5F96
MNVRAFIITTVLLALMLTGCSEEISYDSNNTYSVINEIKEDAIVDGKPQYKEVYIFKDFESYKKYYQDYYNIHSEIVVPDEIDFNNENLLVYNTVLNKSNKGVGYGIDKIIKRGNKIKIYLNADSYIKVNSEKNDKYYNNGRLVIVDKNTLSDDNEIIVIREEKNNIGVTVNYEVN